MNVDCPAMQAHSKCGILRWERCNYKRASGASIGAGRWRVRAMGLLRGVGGILTFVIGLFAIASGLYGMAAMWAAAAHNHQPVDLAALAVGLAACAIGVLSLFLSRTIDLENGPVRSYRSRSKKSRKRT